MLRSLALAAGQQAAWWACALSAAAGRPALGLVVALGFVAACVGLAADRWAEERLLLAAAATGAAGDGALVAAGLLAFPPGAALGPAPLPAWLPALWAAFAALLRGPLAWLAADLRLAAVAGAAAGPLAYHGGAALGALGLAGPAGLVGVGAVYFAAVPWLAWLSRRPEGAIDRLLDASVVLSFDRTGFRRHARRFAPLEPRLAGKVALVTGASSGIGLATARGLLALGAAVRLVCRDEGRGRAALEALRAAAPDGDARLDLLDVSDLDAVRRYAAGLPDPAIDVLVHNAGALVHARTLTPQGLEQTFATHVAGPWLLTSLLGPRLRRGARVIFVASGGMYPVRLSCADLAWAARPFDGVAAYAQAKRMQVVAAELLAARWAAAGVDVHAMHPGWADTPGVRVGLPGFHRLTRRLLRTPEEGADTVVWLAAAAPAPPTGRFWFDRQARATHLLPWTRETAAEREALRAALEAATGVA